MSRCIGNDTTHPVKSVNQAIPTHMVRQLGIAVRLLTPSEARQCTKYPTPSRTKSAKPKCRQLRSYSTCLRQCSKTALRNSKVGRYRDGKTLSNGGKLTTCQATAVQMRQQASELSWHNLCSGSLLGSKSRVVRIVFHK